MNSIVSKIKDGGLKYYMNDNATLAKLKKHAHDRHIRKVSIFRVFCEICDKQICWKTTAKNHVTTNHGDAVSLTVKPRSGIRH